MDKPKPNIGQPEEQPEQPGEGVKNDNPGGDFTLDELMRAHNRNVDPAGRRIDRPEDD
jgi:hypothetical protein